MRTWSSVEPVPTPPALGCLGTDPGDIARASAAPLGRRHDRIGRRSDRDCGRRVGTSPLVKVVHTWSPITPPTSEGLSRVPAARDMLEYSAAEYTPGQVARVATFPMSPVSASEVSPWTLSSPLPLRLQRPVLVFGGKQTASRNRVRLWTSPSFNQRREVGGGNPAICSRRAEIPVPDPTSGTGSRRPGDGRAEVRTDSV